MCRLRSAPFERGVDLSFLFSTLSNRRLSFSQALQHIERTLACSNAEYMENHVCRDDKKVRGLRFR